MPVQRVTQKWSGKVGTVTLGPENASIELGGHTTLPFLYEEGEMRNPPRIAMEVYDKIPEGLPAPLLDALGDMVNDPVAWAQACVQEWHADMICFRLYGPTQGEVSADTIASLAQAIQEAAKIPLIVWGTGDDALDNVLLPRCSQALRGSRCLFGAAKQDNYKTLAATCIADGHSVIAESPIDINICKQINILLSEMDLPIDRMVIYPANGALGYGFEYAYSIMERTRIAALGGDRMMAMPLLAVVGPEVYRTKEAKTTEAEAPQWGIIGPRGVAWEACTAIGYLQAGADVVTLCHPESVAVVRDFIDKLSA